MSVAVHRIKKDKQNPHYNFLYSWQPPKAGVKGESRTTDKQFKLKLSASKNAAELAKKDSTAHIKKDIFKTLAWVSFVLILEAVVYLARNQVRLP